MPKKTLLFITPAMPELGGNGLAIRAGNLVEILSADWAVHVVVLAVGGVAGQRLPSALEAVVAGWVELPYGDLLDPVCVRCLRTPPGPERLAQLHALDRPLDAAYLPNKAAEAAYRAFPGVTFDAVFVLRLYMSAVAERFLSMTPRPMLALDADDDDVEARARFADLRMSRGDKMGALLESAASKAYAEWEQDWLPRFDLIYAASHVDAERIAARNPLSVVDVIPNVLREPAPQRAGVPADAPIPLLMVGNMSYLPNVDGAVFFAREVLPLIRARMPEAGELVIAGSNPAPAVTALARLPGVSVAASPPDIDSFYHRAKVAVIPIRAGGGTRIKLIEAFAHRVPVVSTRLGAEGLAVAHEQHLLLADEPAAFADACVRLMGDAELRGRLTDAAKTLQLAEYSVDALRASMSRGV